MNPSRQRPRRVAYATLILPDGTRLLRQVVCFDGEGRPVSHYPLTAEEPFVEWRKATYHWPADETRGAISHNPEP